VCLIIGVTRTVCLAIAATYEQPGLKPWTHERDTPTAGGTMSLVEEVRAGKLPPREIAREIRCAAGASQERMADELHVHRMTIARWESGQRTPRGKLRADYARLLAELQSVIEAA
jgi:DNA-binding XRE family transcriptional regulator